jgi:hypothetical protein
LSLPPRPAMLPRPVSPYFDCQSDALCQSDYHFETASQAHAARLLFCSRACRPQIDLRITINACEGNGQSGVMLCNSVPGHHVFNGLQLPQPQFHSISFQNSVCRNPPRSETSDLDAGWPCIFCYPPSLSSSPCLAIRDATTKHQPPPKRSPAIIRPTHSRSDPPNRLDTSPPDSGSFSWFGPSPCNSGWTGNSFNLNNRLMDGHPEWD